MIFPTFFTPNFVSMLQICNRNAVWTLDLHWYSSYIFSPVLRSILVLTNNTVCKRLKNKD